MKLQCDVELINRMLPTMGVKNRGKGVKSMLTIGRQEKRGAIYIMVCTQKDKAGSRYKLQDNIEQLFTRFMDEGKATIRLKEPSLDICLSKSDVKNLKLFISAVKLSERGIDCSSTPLTCLAPTKPSDIDRPRTRMYITCQSDYPTMKGFPHTLERLQVSFCKLTRIDMRMLCLKKLQKLDLATNHIKKLPKTIGDLVSLQELILTNNHLESFEPALCSSTLSKTLKSLDLRENKLKGLPVQFGQLKELVTLKLDENELVYLPFTFGHLSKLRYLSATKNKLLYLPNSFKMLSLASIDLFGNPFVQETPMVPDIKLKIPLTLVESAARVTIRHRIPHGPNLIPFTLCQDISVAKICACNKPCLDSFIQAIVLMSLHQVSESVVLVDTMGGTDAPIVCYFCSLTCYSMFLDRYFQSTRV
ncbi:leucine-rich repeat protein 1 [Discoglossus pictus]